MNDREMYGSGCKVPGECMGVGAKYHGEWSGCKVPGECRGMLGERTREEAKCQGNAGECRGIQGYDRGTLTLRTRSANILAHGLYTRSAMRQYIGAGKFTR